MSVGFSHACGLTPSGEVVCWGSNRDGQLDSPAGTFVEVDAGTDFTCALTRDGAVLCWGDDEEVFTEYGA